MDVRAVVLIGGAEAPGSEQARIAQRPMALLDVLGKPVLHHVIERLRRHGVGAITVVTDVAEQAPRAARDAQRPDVEWLSGAAEAFWRLAETHFTDFSQDGAELIFVVRLGAYAEVDYESVMQFHIEQHCRATQVQDAAGPLETWLFSASRRNDAAFLLRNHLQKQRETCTGYRMEGYCNRLATPADLRRLAEDGLMRRAELAPAGRQMKPGVWVGEGARIERGTRLVAPVFIGARARIRAGALLTRGSSVEHHAEIDCGSVVDSATVLPYSYVGPGLDVAHAVVGFHQLQHLRRNVCVEISDPKLVGEVTHSANLRMLKKAAGLAAYLPGMLLRGMRNRQPVEPAVDLAESKACAPDAVKSYGANVPPTDPPGFSTDFAVVRRYGNQ